MSDWGQGDIYEQERRGREVDRAIDYQERNTLQCHKCKQWFNKHVIHECSHGGDGGLTP